jgi:hypothetical protein
MTSDLSRDQLHQLTKLGARVRLAEIGRERTMLAAIINGQPLLQRQPSTVSSEPVKHRRGRPAAAAQTVVTDGRRRRRRRGKLSAAGRAAISAAQKKRWAAIKRKRAGK